MAFETLIKYVGRVMGWKDLKDCQFPTPCQFSLFFSCHLYVQCENIS